MYLLGHRNSLRLHGCCRLLRLLLLSGCCSGDLLRDGKSGDGGDLVDLGGVGQVEEAGADRFLDSFGLA